MKTKKLSPEVEIPYEKQIIEELQGIKDALGDIWCILDVLTEILKK